MSFTYPLQIQDPSQRRRILLLMVLNLFLMGLIGAFLVRYYFAEPERHRSANPSHRVERIAARLPAGDAAILHMEFATRSEEIEQASDAFRIAREKVRLALRAEPFDAGAARTAMAEAGTKRQRLDELTQDVIASAAAKMTAEGRKALAGWPSRTRVSSEDIRFRFPFYTWLHSR
jgi:Spy/CpxP family protein refolding chaperone